MSVIKPPRDLNLPIHHKVNENSHFRMNKLLEGRMKSLRGKETSLPSVGSRKQPSRGQTIFKRNKLKTNSINFLNNMNNDKPDSGSITLRKQLLNQRKLK
mmetsp:Transcript_28366/g.25082  ORF Transcript_28366/g.25082 Transcript_28366/m.25082 type:complete len:100 (+) Transcript_28366:317-616(+)